MDSLFKGQDEKWSNLGCQQPQPSTDWKSVACWCLLVKSSVYRCTWCSPMFSLSTQKTAIFYLLTSTYCIFPLVNVNPYTYFHVYDGFSMIWVGRLHCLRLLQTALFHRTMLTAALLYMFTCKPRGHRKVHLWGRQLRFSLWAFCCDFHHALFN